MASVWCAMAHDRKDTKVAGRLSLGDAKRALEATAKRWEKGAPNRSLRTIGLDEIHLMVTDLPRARCDGSSENHKHVAGHLWIEPCSPPSKPTGGDVYRGTKTRGE